MMPRFEMNTGNGEATVTKSKDDLVDFLVQEIREEFRTKSDASRDGLFYYDVVRGGNVQVIESVVRTLKDLSLDDELSWIMGINPNRQSLTSDITTGTRARHVLMYLLYSVLCVLLTPVFYIVHTTLYYIRDNMKTKLISKMKLMFLHAVVSLQPDMIRLFMECGCDLVDTDERGNNIFHYLAAMSVEQPEKAIQGHKNLCSCYDTNTSTVIRTVLMEHRNIAGSTALEDVAKYGSLTYLKYLLEQDGCIGKLIVHVGSGNIWLNDKRATVSFIVNTPDGSVVDIDVAEPRVVLPTNELLPVPNIEPPTDTCTSNHTLKIWEMNVSQYDRGDALGRNSYLLQLITSHQVEKLVASDVQFLFESRFIKTWFSYKRAAYSLGMILGNLLCISATVLILADVIAHGGDRNTRPLVLIMANNLATFLENNTNNSIHPHDTTTMRDHLSMGLKTSQDKILKECVRLDAKTEVVKQRKELLVQITNYLDVTTREFHPNISLGFNDWLGMLIIGFLMLQAVLDIWFRLAFLWSNYGWHTTSVCHGIVPVIERWLPGSYVDKQLMALIYSMFAVIVILIWTTENQLYITPAYPENSNETYTWFVESIKEFRKAVNESAEMEQVISNMYVICLMVSFLHTVHILRLVPGINFFIITTKKMSKHLLEFAVVFLIVFLVFSAVFYMVMRDPACPVDKMREFQSVTDSLFSTYSMILGHTTPDFTQSVRSQIAYISCTIFIIIIMLNLVIALMTMTATEMRARPWKMVMCRMEFCEEILGTEARVLMLWQPVKSLVAAIRRRFDSRCCFQCKVKRSKLVLKVVHFE